jgi:hypothetical protein
MGRSVDALVGKKVVNGKYALHNKSSINNRGSAAFFAVSIRLTARGFFPRGYASALVSA